MRLIQKFESDGGFGVLLWYWNDVGGPHTSWEVGTRGSQTFGSGDWHLQVISSVWVEVKARTVGKWLQRVWGERWLVMECWGMPSLRGRGGQRQMGLPRMLQGAAGGVKGGGGGRVGTEPMQCFEEKMGNECQGEIKEDQQRMDLVQVGQWRPRWANEFWAGALRP